MIQETNIAWNAVFGRLGSRSDPVDLAEDSPGSEEDWEDLDNVKAAEIERKKRILKGRIARAEAREREKSSDPNTLMPPKKDPVGKPSARRTSIGRSAPLE